MNEREQQGDGSQPVDIKSRPSRARYDKVKAALDLKWRRRGPQPERMMREVVDNLWDAFGDAPWTWCGFWLPQPDGKAFQPGPARLDPAPASTPAEGDLGKAYTTGQPQRAGRVIFIPVLDKNGRVLNVFEARSAADFDDMDARWIERLFKAFQLLEKTEPPAP